MSNHAVVIADPVLLALDDAPEGARLSDEERAALAHARADQRAPLAAAAVEAVLDARSRDDG